MRFRFWKTKETSNLSKTEADSVFDDSGLRHLPDHVKNYVYLRDHAPVAHPTSGSAERSRDRGPTKANDGVTRRGGW